MDINNAFRSRKFEAALIALAALIVLLLVFKAGEIVGFKKASFSYSWAENYHRNFGAPASWTIGRFFAGLDRDDYIGAHGTAGVIMKIDGNTLIIKGQDGAEKTVLVSGKTELVSGRDEIALADLKQDERAVVIGSPDSQGRIDAEFIRVFNR